MTMRVWFIAVSLSTLARAAVAALAQAPGKPAIDLPDAYGPGVKFGELPAGRQWGGVIAVTPDRDGHNIWAFERCGSGSCVNSDLPPVLVYSLCA